MLKAWSKNCFKTAEKVEGRGTRGTLIATGQAVGNLEWRV